MNPNQPVAASAALATCIDWTKLGDLQGLIEAINQGKVGDPLTKWLQAKSWEATVAQAIEKRTLTAWKTIQVGGVSKKDLVAGLKDMSSDWAKDIMGKPAFTVAPEQQSVGLVSLSLAELGFTENPRTDEFMTAKFCEEWSAKHLDGQVIELCTAEDGPHLRLQYDDQPKGDYVWMAMERITGSDGDPIVFYVKRYGDGKRWLFGYYANPGFQWSLGHRIVFRLRKITQS